MSGTQRLRISLDSPGVTREDEAAVLEALRSDRLVLGSRGRLLEEDLARATGRRHAVVVSSGTAALEVGLRAVGVGPGATVAVPALTFPAPAAAAVRLGARLLLVDVEPATMNLDPIDLKRLTAHERITHVVAIDQFGNPADHRRIEAVAKQTAAVPIVDAACSLGSKLDGRPCGGWGRVSTLSLHPRKIITSGEGGAVLTDDDDVARFVRRQINHGIEDGVFTEPGTNLRLGEVAAALGRSQLKRLEETVVARRALAQRYLRLPIEVQREPVGGSTNRQTVVAVLPERLGGARGDLLETARSRGIEVGIAAHCLTTLPWVRKLLGEDLPGVPNAVALGRRAFALPLYSGLGEDEVDEVVELVGNWLAERSEV